MSEQSAEEPEPRASGIPRDLPDQQAGGQKADAQWYADRKTDAGDEAEEQGVPEEGEEELPDTDEAGTGPRTARQREAVDPNQPPPVEPTD